MNDAAKVQGDMIDLVCTSLGHCFLHTNSIFDKMCELRVFVVLHTTFIKTLTPEEERKSNKVIDNVHIPQKKICVNLWEEVKILMTLNSLS